ncbi:MAG TPA: tripartite tricarboxylate transporter TctB family protein [Anaeromyxobacter sp.]
MEPRAELRRDRLSGAVLLAAAAAYLWMGRGYALDTLADPGPGLFPRAAGLALALLAAAQLVSSSARLRRAASPAAAARDEAGGPVAGPARRLQVGILVLLLVAYALVLSAAGFLASTFCLTVACSKLMGARGWSRPIALAAGVLLACHLLFSVWLDVPLPAGFLR